MPWAPDPGRRAGQGRAAPRAGPRGPRRAARHGAAARAPRVDEALAELRELPGIGEWTASGVLTRGCGVADTLPLGDRISREAVRHFHGLARFPDDEAWMAIAEPWRPYRMWATVLLHMAWRRDQPGESARPTRRGPRVRLEPAPTDTRPKAARGIGPGRGKARPGTLGTRTMNEETPMQTHDETPRRCPCRSTRATTSCDGEWIESPIDDETYNLLMALTSKLEAIDVYQVYAEDGNASLWRELAAEERRQADRLLAELKERFAGA